MTYWPTREPAAGKITPSRELVFIPAGGVRGVKAAAGIVGGRDEVLPVTLVDSDKIGSQMAKDLRSGLYSGSVDRGAQVRDFTDLANAEVEDLIPSSVMVAAATKALRGPEEDYSEVYASGSAIVLQMEAYAEKHGIILARGWRVDLAR